MGKNTRFVLVAPGTNEGKWECGCWEESISRVKAKGGLGRQVVVGLPRLEMEMAMRYGQD